MNHLILLPLALVGLILLLIHLGFRPPRRRERGTPEDLGIPYQALWIPTIGGKRLFAWLLPVTGARDTVIVLHGWGGNAELMLPLAIPFHRAGLNVLLLDARNHGRSDAAVFTSLPRFAEDVGHAVDWLKRQFPKNSRKIALLGHSVGAGAVLFETSRRDDIAVVISISAFAHPRWMMQRFLNRWYLPAPLAAGIIRYVQWVIQHPYDEIAPIRTLCHINCPVLLVHGKEDDTVPITDAREMIRRCHRDNIQLLEVDEAGHDSVERIEEQSDALVGFLHKAGFMRCADLTPAPASPPSDHR